LHNKVSCEFELLANFHMMES